LSGERAEVVEALTLDDALIRQELGAVAFAKIDVEGFDALVLRGAGQALATGAIEIVQFEYNWRWLLNAQSLYSVFRHVECLPYRLGKQVNGGLVFFEAWHQELDRFVEGNYVLVRRGSELERIGHLGSFDASNALVIR
jgi:hypothetical protein